ncbi:hypothetical protein BGW36DRAFT_354364 [Talaromyces proteolyticus]|uniref:C2H2-type domain-containing protein n=1 Tax=Talaromyces proteolyticus TaxID=1131652 RepID=A0AAD4L7F9_9EURO|nr:uncharacterized protein BGW36DRAFT_354364 [Talaromyces proteolyticus]KAH8705980.1 hypothetical protein BGW36DRAFT_354364 [Talaromyces proteolyticus]
MSRSMRSALPSRERIEIDANLDYLEKYQTNPSFLLVEPTTSQNSVSSVSEGRYFRTPSLTTANTASDPSLASLYGDNTNLSRKPHPCRGEAQASHITASDGQSYLELGGQFVTKNDNRSLSSQKLRANRSIPQRYVCLLCEKDEPVELSPRPVFKRHVEEQHQPRHVFRCPSLKCVWETHRRSKVLPHIQRMHPSYGSVDENFITGLATPEAIPQKCPKCDQIVTSWEQWFRCFESHCHSGPQLTFPIDHQHVRHPPVDDSTLSRSPRSVIETVNSPVDTVLRTPSMKRKFSSSPENNNTSALHPSSAKHPFVNPIILSKDPETVSEFTIKKLGNADVEKDKLEIPSEMKNPVPPHLPRFACPFFKRWPDRFRNCSGSGHKKPAQVKQHIRRRHKRPTEPAKGLDGLERRDTIQNTADEYDLSPATENIWASEHQLQELGKRSSKRSDRENWNEIYEILFPNDPFPPDPYVDTSIPEDANFVREIFLRDVLPAHGNHIRGVLFGELSEQRISKLKDDLNAISINGFQKIFDTIRGNSTSRPQPLPVLQGNRPGFRDSLPPQPVNQPTGHRNSEAQLGLPDLYSVLPEGFGVFDELFEDLTEENDRNGTYETDITNTSWHTDS